MRHPDGGGPMSGMGDDYPDVETREDAEARYAREDAWKHFTGNNPMVVAEWDGTRREGMDR